MKFTKICLLVCIASTCASSCMSREKQDEEKQNEEKQEVSVVQGLDNDYSSTIKNNLWGWVEDLKHVNWVKKVKENEDNNCYKIEVEVEPVGGFVLVQHGFVYVYEDGDIDKVTMLNDGAPKK